MASMQPREGKLMDMRKTIIDILLSTRSLPEGVAADAIISAIGSGAEQRDRDEEKLITERDHWEDLATTLALRVGEHFDIDVGEHTSSNCPVVRAVEIFDLRDDWLRPAPTAQDSKVPEGWKLIPAKPTTAALYALAAVDGYARGDRDMPGLARWEDYYRAVYDASSIAGDE